MLHLWPMSRRTAKRKTVAIADALSEDRVYPDPMKLPSGIVFASFIAAAGTAAAMNWEGHDDWMVDHPAAMAFGAAVPEAQPVRRKPACGSKGYVVAPDNP